MLVNCVDIAQVSKFKCLVLLQLPWLDALGNEIIMYWICGTQIYYIDIEFMCI